MLNNNFIDNNVILWKELAPEKIIDNCKIVIKNKDIQSINIILESDDFTDEDLNYDYDIMHDNNTKINEKLINVF
jgi:ABC-type uncharacterized transport system substrate-binding protein